jgi:hypothetical protein
MKKLFITILLIFIYGICSASEFQQIDDRTMYFFTSDKEITLAWDDVNNGSATEHDMYLYSVERKSISLIAHIPAPSLEVKFQVPKTGHYIIYVRAVKSPLTQAQKDSIDSKTTMTDLKALVIDNDHEICDAHIWWNDNATLNQMKTAAKASKGLCSTYSVSTDKNVAKVTLPDSTVVDRGWWLYGYPAPPTGGGVN